MTGKRLRRTPSERENPIRNAMLAFRTQPSQNTAIDRAVDTAYQVFEEYMNYGKESAKRHRSGPSMRDLPPNPATMAMRYWMDMAQMWMEPWASFMSNGGAWAVPRAESSDAEPAAVDARIAVRVILSSSQPAEVTVNLRDATAGSHFIAQDLRSVDTSDAPPLSALHVEMREETLEVHVTIPRDQPVGTYVGAVIDRDKKNARGTISIVVGSKSGSKASS